VSQDLVSQDSTSSDGESLLSHGYTQAGLCFLAICLLHFVSTLVAIWCVRDGQLGQFTPGRLLVFVPLNLDLWRMTWLTSVLANLSLVVLAVVMREILERRYRSYMLVALILVAIGASNCIAGQMDLMVSFADLCRGRFSHPGALGDTSVQLAWSLFGQSVTRCALTGNSLYGLASIIILGCALSSRLFPRGLAMLCIPLAPLIFTMSYLAFFANFYWLLWCLLVAETIFVTWTFAVGFVFLNYKAS
jgi:hypothetical protein